MTKLGYISGRLSTIIATVILVLFVFSDKAIANAGLPMLAVVWPLSIFAFIPVVAIESLVLYHGLKIQWCNAITQVVKANILSTIIGVPLAWLASVALEFALAFLFIKVAGLNSYPPHAVGKVGGVVLSAPWLGPFNDGGHWIVPLATMMLLIPFFFTSRDKRTTRFSGTQPCNQVHKLIKVQCGKPR